MISGGSVLPSANAVNWMVYWRFSKAWLATFYSHFLSTFLVIGFVFIKNKCQWCLIHIGMIPWSICASPSLSMFLREVRILTYEVVQDFFVKHGFSLVIIFYFFDKIPQTLWQTFWRFQHVQGMSHSWFALLTTIS